MTAQRARRVIFDEPEQGQLLFVTKYRNSVLLRVYQYLGTRCRTKTPL
jgi:hypothetical protein